MPLVETETHGWLVPATDPMPNNWCSGLGPVPSDALRLVVAGGGAYTTAKDKFLIIKLGDCKLLWMQRGPQGLLLDADILRRQDSSWHVLEVKSSFSDSNENRGGRGA